MTSFINNNLKCWCSKWSNQENHICDVTITDEHEQIETATKQSRSGQDFITAGQTENIKWILVLDGHGKSKTINYLKTINWNEIIEKENFDKIVFEGIQKLGNTKTSGSTISIVKIYLDHFECLWVGDSTIKIYCENNPIFKMQNHDQNHPEEMKKIEKMNVEKKIAWAPEILSEKDINMKMSYYYHFAPNDVMNMTHSLGHNSITGKYFEKKTICRDPTKQYKVLLATDGLWDMSYQQDDSSFCKPEMTAPKMLDLALKRWKREWNYNGKLTKFPEGSEDDIAIGTCVVFPTQ